MSDINKKAWEDFVKKHPEHISKSKKKRKSKIQYVCQCNHGHLFNYIDRIRYPDDDTHYAPCQGKCPICHSTEFSCIENGTNIYPVKWNFT